MPSVQRLRDGTRLIRITLFARWGRLLKPQWIQGRLNTNGVIVDANNAPHGQEETACLKTTRYFEEQVLRKRPYILREWCQNVLAAPLRREVQFDGRIRFWGRVV